jgi:NAD(P)-dependent dehydrogenase (short-subunit alcohol dehydrogenase family)
MKPESGKLKGKRVVLTGISRGVGREIALLFLTEGAQILGVSRNRANLAKAGRDFSCWGKSYSAVLADVSSPAAPARIAAAARRRWSAVDLLINNAAINPGVEPFIKEPAGTLERTLETNVLAPYRLTRALLPLLLRGRNPRVVNLSSGAGSFHSVSHGKDMSSYRLSKFVVNGLTMLFANELAGKVSVVAMDPGWVKTDMGGPGATDHPSLSARRAFAIALMPASVSGKYLAGDQVLNW